MSYTPDKSSWWAHLEPKEQELWLRRDTERAELLSRMRIVGVELRALEDEGSYRHFQFGPHRHLQNGKVVSGPWTVSEL